MNILDNKIFKCLQYNCTIATVPMVRVTFVSHRYDSRFLIFDLLFCSDQYLLTPACL